MKRSVGKAPSYGSSTADENGMVRCSLVPLVRAMFDPLISFFRALPPLALIPLGLFAWLVQRRVRSWWLLLPLAVATWVLVHESGVHATIAGVVLGGVSVELVRSARHHGGSGNWGDLLIPVVVVTVLSVERASVMTTR